MISRELGTIEFQIILPIVFLIVPSRNIISEGNQTESSDIFNRRRLFRFCRLRGWSWRVVPEAPLPPGESNRDYEYMSPYKYGELLRQRQKAP